MPAHSDNFPWMSYYGEYDFFEQRMREHSKVKSIANIQPGLYNIDLINNDSLIVFICECYSFDIAEYIESQKNYGHLDAVVISSNWCGYSLDVKRRGIKEQVGVFTIAGFMAAINRDKYWTYLTQGEQKIFQENGGL